MLTNARSPTPTRLSSDAPHRLVALRSPVPRARDLGFISFLRNAPHQPASVPRRILVIPRNGALGSHWIEYRDFVKPGTARSRSSNCKAKDCLFFSLCLLALVL